MDIIIRPWFYQKSQSKFPNKSRDHQQWHLFPTSGPMTRSVLARWSNSCPKGEETLAWKLHGSDQMDQRKTERKLQHDPDLTSRSMLLYSLAHLMLDDVRCQSPSNRSKLQRDPRPPKKRQVQLGRVQPPVVFPSQGRHPKSFKTLL